MPIIIQKGTQSERSNTIRLGDGLNLSQDTDGLPLLSTDPAAQPLNTGGAGELLVEPSGVDDTENIRAAVWQAVRVRLGPGQFNVSGTIDLPSGCVVTGTGTNRTQITRTIPADGATGPVFRMGDNTEYAAVEHLTIVGPGHTVPGYSGVVAARSASGLAVARGVRVRSLVIREMGDHAVYFSKVAHAECTGLTVEGCAKSGFFVKGSDQVVCSNLAFRDTGDFGLFAQDTSRLHCVGLVTLGSRYHGVLLERGTGNRLSGVRVTSSGPGILLRGVAGTVVDAAEVADSPGAFHLDSSFDVALSACRSVNSTDVPLRMTGGANHTVASFVSDQGGLGTFVDRVHLLVVGTTGAVIDSIRTVNPPAILGTLTAEADVSQADGRVMVGRHNMEETRLITGGKFARFAYNAI